MQIKKGADKGDHSIHTEDKLAWKWATFCWQLAWCLL